MKPKPFASLNHLTVPEVLMGESPFCAAFGDSNPRLSSRSAGYLMYRATGARVVEFRDSKSVRDHDAVPRKLAHREHVRVDLFLRCSRAEHALHVMDLG